MAHRLDGLERRANGKPKHVGRLLSGFPPRKVFRDPDCRAAGSPFMVFVNGSAFRAERRAGRLGSSPNQTHVVTRIVSCDSRKTGSAMHQPRNELNTMSQLKSHRRLSPVRPRYCALGHREVLDENPR